jgi:AcrR family transcriptional regulator
MEATKVTVERRILEAAREEFARFGLAGARVDRIAKGASTSKDRIYAHFSDKVALFQAVLDLNVQDFFESVTLRSDDVVQFVSDLFDHSVEYPDHLRVLTWARLEGFQYELDSKVARLKVAAIAEAQRRGLVDASWEPEVLLELLFAIGHSGAQSPGPRTPLIDRSLTSTFRSAAVEAARRLIEPRGN